MLVLTRKRTGRIILTAPALGGEIVVEVLAITPRTVRLGFDAPDEVKIMRAELVVPPAGGDGQGVA